MKYSQVDWSKWDDRPDEQTYNDWCKVRKGKITQTAINRTAPHINKLYQSGTSADEAVAIAAENCWTGIKYNWVMNAISRDMDGLSDYVEPKLIGSGSTRDVPLERQLNDGSWGIGMDT